MTEIISNTPTYVWFILALLVWGGWKSTKTHTVSWKTLCIMPAMMLIWSLYANLINQELTSLTTWALHFALGLWWGSTSTRKLQLTFDKQQKLIRSNGTWLPLILSLSIFTLRYTLAATPEIYPELQGTPALVVLENLATFATGICLGRLIGFWQLYKKSPHTDLGVVKA